MYIFWPLQTPVHCWIIHFVHKYNQMLDSSSFGQHGMLPRLASFLKARFKLSFPCRDYLQIEIMKNEFRDWSEWTVVSGLWVKVKPFETDIGIQIAPSTVSLLHSTCSQLSSGEDFFPMDIFWIVHSMSGYFSRLFLSAYSMLWLTSTAKSACEAPPIMLGTKLLWPGASRMVKCFFSVSKYARPTSTVFPLSLSSWFVSRAQERYLRKTINYEKLLQKKKSTEVLWVSAVFGGNLFDCPPDVLVN